MDIAAALRAFVRTVERGSITDAARDLKLSQPGVTKHLQNLERHVGARLLERSSRAVRPTFQGQALYEASREALSSIDAALEGVRQNIGRVEGHLRVHAPSCIGTKHLHRIVMAFQRLHPSVTADLILDNRDVDLVYENFDVAVKYGRPLQQELIIRRLGSIRRILVAAPRFIETYGAVATIERLAQVPLVVSSRSLTSADTIRLRDLDGQARDVVIQPVLRTNSAPVISATLLEGHAAGPVQQIMVNEDLAAGRLVRILPEYEVEPTEAFLAYPSLRFMSSIVRAFTDFAVAELGALDGIVDRHRAGDEFDAIEALPQRKRKSESAQD
ncbi:LysR family transcriptional regulator [Rhizobium sp. SSA_523]|uniref:LysR family transcriptional regulator n=1 Tax=Rhizobium sp. SSA_523 TaxID=2952477 RepID=UPI00209010CD|nr:LysR family transcriptional regulator [Rhizobium sp. SSA_523]MCO5733447.1 LysR substrate-binding domain-containing protein [Rhizobium sp. SSA_523]WKC21584.1 LysR substrate-binding domain-containing protein [Rhizobium sp. SSA_523]